VPILLHHGQNYIGLLTIYYFTFDNMRRRKFIGIAAIGATAIGLTGIGCQHTNEGFGNVLNRPLQLSHICNIGTIREIGIAYRGKIHGDDDPKRLVKVLLTDAAGKKILESAGDTGIRSLLDQKIKQDFETSDIVIVNGWILSATEARQCALFSFKSK
jgi:hypothetical protein